MKTIEWGKVEEIYNWGALLYVDGNEVLVYNDEQLGPMEVGNEYLIMISQNSKGDYIGTEKIDKYAIETVAEDEYENKQKLRGIVYMETPMGYKVFFDDKYSGLLYKNEIFQKIEIGQEVDVYVKKVRDDLRVDLSLTPLNYKEAIGSIRDIVMDALAKSGGVLNLSDKSTPDEIQTKLGISKKKFKEAIGILYKERKIRIEEERVVLSK